MKRREFLAIAGSVAAVSAPLFARAQQTSKVYRIAIVSPSTPVAEIRESGRPYYRAFFERLRELGYVAGQNLSIEPHSAEGRTEHFAELAAAVVRSKPDLIFVSTSRLTRAFKTATSSIALVASVADPVAYGIVSSLARPGGNITGVTVDAGFEITAKRLQLLREIVPTASTVAYLASRARWESPYVEPLRDAAQRNRLTVVGPPLEAPFQEAEYRRVFALMAQEGVDALMVNEQSENITNRKIIVELAAKAHLPAIYGFREFIDIGGLLAYGVDLPDLYRHAADQVSDILKGTKPAEIPFYQPTKFELVINIETARVLGIDIPSSLLARADEVIE